MYECNAIIERVTLTKADHGILSAWLHLSYGDTRGYQGFGGFCLYNPNFKGKQKSFDACGHFLWRCMEIADVESWYALEGKTIRVRKESGFGKIVAIGHILKDDWFNPTEEFKQMSGKE